MRSDFPRNRFGFRGFDRFHVRPRFPRFPFRDFDDFPFDFDFDDFFFFGRPFFNCFACGLGFGGFNFGFGAPLWWGQPAWPGWSGGIGYPYALSFGYSSPYDYGLAYNSPAYTRSQSDNSSASGTTQGAQNPSAILLLYLKDGTMYSVRDSWLADGKLHYNATDGSEGVIELSAVDIQRTVDENAERGVPFTLKPKPAGPKPAR